MSRRYACACAPSARTPRAPRLRAAGCRCVVASVLGEAAWAARSRVGGTRATRFTALRRALTPVYEPDQSSFAHCARPHFGSPASRPDGCSEAQPRVRADPPARGFFVRASVAAGRSTWTLGRTGHARLSTNLAGVTDLSDSSPLADLGYLAGTRLAPGDISRRSLLSRSCGRFFLRRGVFPTCSVKSHAAANPIRSPNHPAFARGTCSARAHLA